MRSFNRIIALMCCFVIILSIFSVAFAVSTDTREGIFNGNVVSNWMSDATSTGSFGSSGKVGSWSSGHYESNQFKRYYITPTESVQDAQGNVTNYYRGGDTTTTKIIDSYNIGPDTRTTVTEIATITIEEMGLNAIITYTGGDRGWVGDVPEFKYDLTKINKLGWKAPRTSNDAIRLAIRKGLKK